MTADNNETRTLQEPTLENLAAAINAMQVVIDDPDVAGKIKQQVFIDFQKLNHEIHQLGFIPSRDETSGIWTVEDAPRVHPEDEIED